MTRRPAAVAALLTLMFLAGCAGRRRSGAGAAAPSQPRPAPPGLLVQVTDGANGRPLVGADVGLALGGENPLFPIYRRVGQTDERGELRIDLPEPEVAAVGIRATAPGRVPMGIWLALDDGPPSQPAALTLPLATPVGGVVRNEQGEPVEGAEVRVGVAAEPSLGAAGPELSDVAARTGADGRWTMNAFPAAAANAYVMAAHPDYVPPLAGGAGPGLVAVESLRAGTAVTVLRRGMPLGGTVRDDEGHPVTGARVALGFGAGMAGGTGPFAGVTATTDVAGRYRFPHVGTNLTVVTAQAPGRAPDAREVLVREGLGPVDFKLSPGRRLNLRVADPGGAPVAGAAVAAWQWRGRQNLSWSGRTGPDGHLAAADLPADAVTFSITARGKMGVQVELTAGDAEQIVRLPPALHVHGAVVDAETGQPLPRVRVMSGFDLGDGTGTRWDNPAPTVAAGGRYARTFTAPMTAYQLRFEADGYLPETSRPFKSGEGDVVSDVKLRRRTAPAVVVVDGDGNPVEGVEVAALGVGQADVIVEEGHINSWFGRSVPSKSRFDGRVDLDLPVGDFVLLAVGEQGYVSVPSKQLPADTPPRLVLKPWARLTGRTLSGGKPVVGQVVLIRSVRTLRSGDLSLTATVSSHAVSDAQGRFELKRCVTGAGTAARTVMHADRNMMTEEPLANVDVRPPPDVTEVTLGVGGRAVRAKVIPPDDFPADWASNFECMAFLQTVAPPLPLPKNWLAMDEGQRRAWTEQFKQTDAGREWARQQPGEAGFRMVILGRDGTVRLDDVPPGSYVLTAQTSEPHWARLVHEFTVAEAAPGKDEAPVDLGNLELLPRSWPKGATRPAAPKP